MKDSSENANDDLRVLLIEDNEDDALIVRKYLAESIEGAARKFTTTRAGTLREALALLRAEREPDVILVDLSLPDSHGFETFETLQQEWGHLPILVLTGFDSDEHALRAVQRGAQDYILKDRMNSDGLIRAIHYGIERHRIRIQLADFAKRLQGQNRKMRFELKLARQIQQALIPENAPAGAIGNSGPESSEGAWRISHRYLPCRGLAGDFFQIIPLENDCVGILMCDVMGHGVSSALVAALIRGLVEEDESRLDRPGELLTGLNRHLTRILWKRGIEIFATAFYLVADPRGGIRCANAGHPAPIEIPGSGNSARALKIQHPGMALGINEKNQYTEEAHTFAPNQSLLLFTDGICEITDSQGTFFEDTIPGRLENHPENDIDEMLDRLIDDARSFSHAADFSDDVCLVALHFQ